MPTRIAAALADPFLRDSLILGVIIVALATVGYALMYGIAVAHS